MSDWPSLLRERNRTDALDAWFTGIAERLLNGCRLMTGRRALRLVEIEFYWWSAAHCDPFTHRDPIQFSIGHWYFHRTRGTYRGGSFKGLDLTFGQGESSGGILIRGLETPEGALVDGPSLCVDHLLDATGAESVAQLDRAANDRLAWEGENPLLLRARDEDDKRPLVRSPRVGLLLKRVRDREDATRYVMRPYRYLSEPRRTRKGKWHVVLALHAGGESIEAIGRMTNCPRHTIERYVADFEAGRKAADFAPYFGRGLAPAELCRLYGVWSAHFGR
jgi:hypothetical protein